MQNCTDSEQNLKDSKGSYRLPSSNTFPYRMVMSQPPFPLGISKNFKFECYVEIEDRISTSMTPQNLITLRNLCLHIKTFTHS